MSTLEVDLCETIRIIPGYDPYTDTGGAEFVPEKAMHAIDFFHRFLRHVKDGGKSRAGDRLILQPWQIAIIANLFGWIRLDGTRRYRESLIYVPRKNGKTTLSAGIPLYILFCDPEKGKEIYVAAADRKNAGILFNIARDMVLAERELEKRSKILRMAITRESEGSYFWPISAEASTKHGYNASAVLVDELHAQSDRHLVDVLETSQGSRRQPLFVSLTTADFWRQSICNEKHKYACDVRDGALSDPAFLPVIYETLKDEDWKDPEVWRKANPNYGISIREEYFERKFKQAVSEPLFENTFKRLHLNLQTEQEDRFIDIGAWLACSEEYSEEDLAGEVCFGGLDLSSQQDVTAFVLYFPQSARVLSHFWCPYDAARKRERNSQARYLEWARRDFVELGKGGVIDYAPIREYVLQAARRFNLRDVAFDPWNAQDTVNQLEACGIRMTKVSQGFASLNSPTKSLHQKILRREIRHDGNEVLTWMMSNLSVDRDHSDNVRPSKKKSTEKIDGAVALIMAVGVSELGAEPPNPYNSRGFHTL